jgi:hypothetical protein
MNKKILVIHLNEFNLKFLRDGALKYKCKNIIKFLKYKKVKTYSVDKIQDKNLDPWVQSVSINTGLKSKNHRMYNLGQKVPKKLNQIWDILSKQKIKCAIWGTMNSTYINNKNIKIFFPDPWNNKTLIKPNNLNNFFKLPRVYAQDYTNFIISKNLNSILSFFFSCLKYEIINYFLKNFFLYFKIFISSGFKNYFLFFLFDIISLKLFNNLTKNKDLDFSLIFLNSLAHFQHNNWDEKKNYYKYFLLTEEIFKFINLIGSQYNDILIYNGFTQKKIKPEFIIRPKSPKKFLKSIGIKYIDLNLNMTNGGIISFKSKNQKNISVKLLKNYNILGFKLFKITNLSDKSIYFNIQLKSYINFDFTDPDLNNKKKIMKNIFYDNVQLKLQKTNLNTDFKKFKNEMVFIKTTGKHFHKGHLLMKNKMINQKVIQNKDIFLILKNYFKI